jgi:hypothetical protein
VLNQAVKRNIERFPADFMFELSAEETKLVSRSQIVTLDSEATSNPKQKTGNSRSQIVTLKQGANIKYAPYAFTEQGVAMLSSVLRSPRAVSVNVEIMRAFVRLRTTLAEHRDLAGRLDELEGKYDQQFKVVFDAIRALMTPPQKTPRRIGFRAERNP